ncbi:hypothetical protein OIE66_33670 [Nonomuraea sp. NBC_01738]|uniref:hypothetical protein n=1 Tax=Nonomuraea sp. NBC_01738 TaxID=2976003 RepID=UPI002E153FFA|nr:hypothetical protein OIE66_33670 [Nonomuraea sp. NBC_01738]
MTDPSRTIGSATRAIIRQLAPTQQNSVPITAKEIFGGGRISKQAMLHALGEGGGSRPAGFGAGGVGALAGFVMTVLNAVACETLTSAVMAETGAARSWWRRRREHRALATVVAPGGLDTPLPGVSAQEAERIAARVLALASDAGISAELGRRISELITAELISATAR